MLSNVHCAQLQNCRIVLFSARYCSLQAAVFGSVYERMSTWHAHEANRVYMATQIEKERQMMYVAFLKIVQISGSFKFRAKLPHGTTSPPSPYCAAQCSTHMNAQYILK